MRGKNFQARFLTTEVSHVIYSGLHCHAGASLQGVGSNWNPPASTKTARPATARARPAFEFLFLCPFPQRNECKCLNTTISSKNPSPPSQPTKRDFPPSPHRQDARPLLWEVFLFSPRCLDFDIRLDRRHCYRSSWIDDIFPTLNDTPIR